MEIRLIQCGICGKTENYNDIVVQGFDRLDAREVEYQVKGQSVFFRITIRGRKNDPTICDDCFEETKRRLAEFLMPVGETEG